jgi:CDK inhibitor PHO81
LKKFDKRFKSTTKELYLTRQIDVQPCFNNDFLASLAGILLLIIDIATSSIASLDKVCVYWKRWFINYWIN